MPTSSSYRFQATDGEQVSNTKGVVIGVDPHKLSATIAVVDTNEQLVGSGRFESSRGSTVERLVTCENAGHEPFRSDQAPGSDPSSPRLDV
jgi:hypothetical protein